MSRSRHTPKQTPLPPEVQDSDGADGAEAIRLLRRRLAANKRRMRYWANLPGFFGPSRRSLSKANEMYELACDDADSIAQDIEKLAGKPCPVIDVRRTFQVRWTNPKAEPVILRRQEPR